MEETTTQNSNMKVMGGILLLIIVLVGGFIYMRSRDVKEVESQSSEMVQEDMAQQGSGVEAGADTEMKETTESASTDMQTITVEAGGFYYKPNVIKAKVGEKIKIVMTSKDMMHDFVIDELGVKLPITKSGETKEVEFTASKAGTFEFYCSVGQHRKNGQVGQLIVE